MKKELFKSTTGEMHEKPDDVRATWRPSVYGFLCQDDKVLMVKAALTADVWELPGGGVDDGETLLDGLIREFAEETGHRVELLADVPQYIGQNNFYDQYRALFHYGLLLTYEVRLISAERDESLLHQSVEGEIADIAWVNKEELSVENVHHSHWPAVKMFLER